MEGAVVIRAGSTFARRQMPAVAAALALAAGGWAQVKERLPRWQLDPYTDNEPERMARAGYVSYGPFEFGQRGTAIATTEDIEATVPYAQILWVETAHFRIGLSLRTWPLPQEAKTKKKIRAELTELQKVLPKINPKTRRLDPWLRLHLTAYRLEKLYREFLELIGVEESEFPTSMDKVVVGQGRYLGYGPYLGMRQKYLVFVTTEGGTYLDYQTAFIGKTSAFGQRWHFKDIGGLFYGVATKFDDNALKHDTALHCDLTFNVSHLLLAGFRYYAYDLPVWISEGIAHWFERRVDPRWNTFTLSEGGGLQRRKEWQWEAETRKLLAAGKVTPFSEVYTWRNFSAISFNDHVLLWSRWDYLMSRGVPDFQSFLFEVKGRVRPDTWLADQDDLVGATRQALQKVYGLSPINFDEHWREWVLANYAVK